MPRTGGTGGGESIGDKIVHMILSHIGTDDLLAELQRRIGGGPVMRATGTGAKRGRKPKAAATEGGSVGNGKKKRKPMSAAAKAALSAAAKKRWANAKKAGKTSL